MLIKFWAIYPQTSKKDRLIQPALFCLLSIVNGRSKKALEEAVLAAGTKQTLSNLYFLLISMDTSELFLFDVYAYHVCIYMTFISMRETMNNFLRPIL